MAKNDGIFVIFGITGDLAARKLLPALYQLANRDMLPQNFKILGTTRRDTTVEDIIQAITNSLKAEGEEPNPATIDKLRSMVGLVHMDISQEADYSILSEALVKAESSISTPVNRLYYLAVPPNMVSGIVHSLKSHGLNVNPDEQTESRLLAEKPFGRDTASATQLISQIEEAFSEDQIYRVDHYLAKDTAQNILNFRFNNPELPAAWSKDNVKNIIVTASEQIGIEGRVNFYENTGALRDLIQSHLLQLLALVTMEEPPQLSSSHIHQAKLAVLESIQPVKPENSARGQYDTYKQEASNPASTTETYAAIKLFIQNERWEGVPVLLRAGKAMAEKMTEIKITFNSGALTIRIQPNEGILLTKPAVNPSAKPETEVLQTSGNHIHSYERVLIDAIQGDKTLFTTDNEILAAWRIIEEVLKAWEGNSKGLETYQTGSWGPKNAEQLAAGCDAIWPTSETALAFS